MGIYDTCKKCGEPATTFYRCAACYKCDDCGISPAEGQLVTRSGGVVCDDCHRERMNKKMRSFSGDTDRTSEIVCPYCGREWGDGWEMSDGGETECDDCGNRFSYERDVEVTYSTEKIGEPLFNIAA